MLTTNPMTNYIKLTDRKKKILTDRKNTLISDMFQIYWLTETENSETIEAA